MPQQVKSDATLLREIRDMIGRFHAIIRDENAAVADGDTNLLGRIGPEKQRLIRRLDKLWSENAAALQSGPPSRRAAFADLEGDLAALRTDLKRNLSLLNAAKVRGATRIEAGVEAWHRKQREDAGTYGRNGRPAGLDRVKRNFSGPLI